MKENLNMQVFIECKSLLEIELEIELEINKMVMLVQIVMSNNIAIVRQTTASLEALNTMSMITNIVKSISKCVVKVD